MDYMNKKYRFEHRPNGTVIEVEHYDVAEMVKNSHDWKPLDDVAPVLLGDAYNMVAEIQNTQRKKNGNKSRHSK